MNPASRSPFGVGATRGWRGEAAIPRAGSRPPPGVAGHVNGPGFYAHFRRRRSPRALEPVLLGHATTVANAAPAHCFEEIAMTTRIASTFALAALVALAGLSGCGGQIASGAESTDDESGSLDNSAPDR